MHSRSNVTIIEYRLTLINMDRRSLSVRITSNGKIGSTSTERYIIKVSIRLKGGDVHVHWI